MSSHAFSQVYLRVTFHTKENRPMIRGEVESSLHDCLRTRALESPGVEVHAVGGIEDHIHLAARIPPTLLISDWIGDLKGASSWHINHRLKPKTLQWQEGYGVVSFGKRSLTEVIDYIKHQREHHQQGSTHSGLERITTEEPIPVARAQSAARKKEAR
ncbi:MAG: IS200/IS605 family transposase [Acidobacteria bacterium]|nr:IS200/IS605 family transposase [Acidobacteriota bacterium]MCI0621231.1 IS200/IS605 family transposase [Acidobacteriota bacterium]MCI0718101.1 IS200/IS605 family transposase [Acidobacteriota bacterium]